MSKKNIEEIVTGLAAPIVDMLDFELVEVEFVKEAGSWYLRVYIDKPGGIAIDDCQAVSERLSDLLDEKDPIPQSYILEVSSPGIDRPLKKDRDFEKNRGKNVEVKLFQTLDGRKAFEGELVGLLDGKVVIQDNKGSRMEFEREKISTVRRIIEF
jgi:ribosome maturation factor RimP